VRTPGGVSSRVTDAKVLCHWASVRDGACSTVRTEVLYTVVERTGP
jgi:hypothetical protein